MKKPTVKWFAASISVITLIVLAFIGGVYFGPKIWIAPPSLHSSQTMVSVSPPPDGPLYTTDDYARANGEVNDYLKRKLNEPRYSHLDLRYFVTPEISGYITHTYSGDRGEGFPEELESEAYEIFNRALNNK